MEMFSVAEHEPSAHGYYSATMEGEFIIIPYRVYFHDCHPFDFKCLTSQQMAVLSAIMTRHHSGYQRELWATQLLRYPVDWTVPFIAYLLGDYVVEILKALEAGLSPEWEDLFLTFKLTGLCS